MKIYFSAEGSEGITAEKFKQTNKQPTRETKNKTGKQKQLYLCCHNHDIFNLAIRSSAIFIYI